MKFHLFVALYCTTFPSIFFGMNTVITKPLTAQFVTNHSIIVAEEHSAYLFDTKKNKITSLKNDDTIFHIATNKRNGYVPFPAHGRSRSMMHTQVLNCGGITQLVNKVVPLFLIQQMIAFLQHS